MPSDDIKHRASKLEKLMLASNQSSHIGGKSKPQPAAAIAAKADALQKLLGGKGRSVSTASAPRLDAKPFSNVSPTEWAKIWVESENCVTTTALEGFAAWTRLWVLEPVRFTGGSVAAAVGSVGGADPNVYVNARISGLLPQRPEAAEFCVQALEIIGRWYLDIRSMLTVPTQMWYPQLVMATGPVVPPTPNVPSPFSAMTQLADSVVAPARVAPQLRALLQAGEVKRWNEHFGQNQKNMGDLVVDLVVARVIHGLKAVFQQSMVTGVMAMGTVPTFAPPHNITGPVMANTLPAVGFLQGVDNAVSVSLLTTANTVDALSL